MTIDLKTGEIVIGETLIKPAKGEDDFLTSVAGKGVTLVRKTATVNWYEIWLPDEPSGRQIGVVFSFLVGGSARQARFKFVKPEIRTAGAWSREVEDEMKSFHDKWLHDEVGELPPDRHTWGSIYRFSWGSIWSAIDQHGYSAVIIIAYGSEST